MEKKHLQVENHINQQQKIELERLSDGAIIITVDDITLQLWAEIMITDRQFQDVVAMFVAFDKEAQEDV